MINSGKPATRMNTGIAVIGMSGRFPDAGNVNAFWENIRNGVDSVRNFSDKELEASGVDPTNINRSNYVKAGAILEDVEMFDADFFNLSARDAKCIDPQHRLLLECAWETLENAGYCSDPSCSIGVFAGCRVSEYLMYKFPTPDMSGLFPDSGPLVSNWKRILDNDKDSLATRIAYLLDLTGPAVTIQTACSTSLVAVHMGCQSLLREECDIILAGGTCVRVPQKAGYLYDEGMIFSPDGHTRPFDAKGEGTIFSSGVGMVALKRLDRALDDGDNIHAVIKGSAVNNDGHGMKAAFTAPAVNGQVEVIKKAHSSAQVEPESISYVEAHGTATTHGDLTEMSSLTQAFRSGTDKKGFCALGSVKANIGHPTQAAGIIGLIKTVLMLKHKELVPQVNFEKPNPKIDFGNSPFFINTKVVEWRTESSPRRAGINSFGVGGTNAHVIVEEGPVTRKNKQDMERPTHILCLSARNERALKELVGRYEEFLASSSNIPVEDVCFTANVGRTHFSHRLAVIADSSAKMQGRLASISAHTDDEDFPEMSVAGSGQPKVAFLFSGQGSQYVDMGRQLFETQPCFRNSMETCDKLLRPFLDESLLSVLYPGSGKARQSATMLEDTLYTQTALFAIEYSLYELWKSWGVEPDIVMGHSVGELVAACVAGVFDLEDGLRLIAARGRLMQGLPGNGAMASVFADEETVAEFLKGYSGKVAVAAVNGPESIVISGEEEALLSMLHELEQENIKVKQLAVSHAFHSSFVEPVMDRFEQVAEEVKFHFPKIKIISNVTGQLVEGVELSCAGYWKKHLRVPVLFASSMKTLEGLGCSTYVELGPDATLLSMGYLCLQNSQGNWLPSLTRRKIDWPRILNSLRTLYLHGTAVDWSGFDKDYPRRRVELPTYPFQRKRHWIDHNQNVNDLKETVRHARLSPSSTTIHPLLGQRLASALSDIQFESRFTINSAIFLEDHHVYGMVVVPATALVEMVLSAVSAVSGKEGIYVVEDLVIREALLLPGEENRIVQTVLTPDEDDKYSFQIFSTPENDFEDNGEWKLHVSGKVHQGDGESSFSDNSLQALRKRCNKELVVKKFYQDSLERGMAHGPKFQAIERLWQGNGEAVAEIQLPEELLADAEIYQVHPVLLDASLHMGKAAFPECNKETADEDIYLPTIFERIQIYRPFETRIVSYVTIRPSDEVRPEIRTIDTLIFNLDGNLVAEIQGLHFKRAARKSLLKISAGSSLDNWLYEVNWQETPLTLREAKPDQKHKTGIWLVFANHDEISSELVCRLGEYGQRCILVFPGEFTENFEKNICSLNPTCPEDFERLIGRVLLLPAPLCGVVHLWSLDRTFSEEMSSISLMEAQVLGCGSGLHLIQALVKEQQSKPPSLWFVSRGSQSVTTEDHTLNVEHSPLWGLGRVAAREHPKLRCVMVDLDSADRQDEDLLLFNELCADEFETQISFRQQQRYVARLVRAQGSADDISLDVPDSENFRLKASSSCLLNNISLQPVKRTIPGPGQVEICVYATGLNFRDVLTALGKYPGDPGPPGRECSGIVAAVGADVQGLRVGDEVLGIGPGCFSRYVTLHAHFVVKKPDILSFEDAATLPITFMTVYHGLYNLCKLAPGEKVLIHAASGGVGLAAIQLVQWAGAEVYATASRGKWEFLESIGIKHIMDSRSLDFADELMSITDGHGVNIVLNSLAGDFIPKSLSVLGERGRFIEIGKNKIWDTAQVAELRPDVSYYPFDLGDIGHNDPVAFQAMFQKLLKGFTEGPLKPLPQKRFPVEGIIQAFRYMAQARHIGKIVVFQPPIGQENTGSFRSNGTYMITGGLGALGLQAASWLAAQNAQHLVLLGRSGPSEHAQEVIGKLAKENVQVTVFQADVSNMEEISTVFKKIRANMPPLRGVIHAAGVLDDGVLTQQTFARFSEVMVPKVAGAWNLHLLTREMALDFFVLFSSVSSFWGSPGQGNYAAANAFLDGLAHLRHAQRLPCVSINWGAWAEVGMAASLDNTKQQNRKTKGIGVIGIESGLALLGKLIRADPVQVAVINVNWTEYIQQFSAGIVPPFFSIIRKNTIRQGVEDKVRKTQQTGLIAQIEQAPENDRRKIVSAHVQEESAKLIGLDPQQFLDPQTPLVDLGLDSLSAIELRNAFEHSFGCTLPATLLYDHPTLEDISTYLTKKIIPETQATDPDSKLLQNDCGQKNGQSSSCNNGVGHGKIKGTQPEGIHREEAPSMTPILTGGSKSPLFFLHYNPLSLHFYLGQDQPLYHLKALWGEKNPPKEICIENIATQHIKDMKTVQPSGPYLLGGYSIGGLIALEVAQQLGKQGEQVDLLFLIEPTTPVKFYSEKIPPSVLDSLHYNLKHTIEGAIRKSVEVGFKSYNALFNSNIPLPAIIRRKRILALYRVAHRKYIAGAYSGRIIIWRVKKKSAVNNSVWEYIAEGGTKIIEMDLKGHHAPLKKENESEWINDLKEHLEKIHAS
jgi:acyl transferase domain-containing protein/acyl carrier protein